MPVPGRSEAYTYDQAPNRFSHTFGSEPTFNYNANHLNQYTNIASGSSGASVYDDDGNLLSTSQHQYTYDAENRLIQQKRLSDANTIDYKYDYMGRMVSRKETGQPETRYVYDGWNIIAELSPDNSGSSDFSSCVQRKHAWGLDVSSTAHKAGGIGALLMTQIGSNPYFPIYDGRANLTGMMDAANGEIKAAYQYGAFGELQSSIGSMKDDFCFGWSTKYTEPEKRLINFGKRWYDTHHGRFINRDPIGEKGGINLYAFLANNPLGGYELLGMGFLSKLWKKIKGFFKKIKKFVSSVWNKFKDTIITVVLAAFNPWLAAAYGAHSGYETGGLIGGILGVAGGLKLGGLLKGASALATAAYAAGAVATTAVTSTVIAALDRRIRGFGKWFGYLSQAVGLGSLNKGVSNNSTFQAIAKVTNFVPKMIGQTIARATGPIENQFRRFKMYTRAKMELAALGGRDPSTMYAANDNPSTARSKKVTAVLMEESLANEPVKYSGSKNGYRRLGTDIFDAEMKPGYRYETGADYLEAFKNRSIAGVSSDYLESNELVFETFNGSSDLTVRLDTLAKRGDLNALVMVHGDGVSDVLIGSNPDVWMNAIEARSTFGCPVRGCLNNQIINALKFSKNHIADGFNRPYADSL